jgi:peptide/nickel transport system substrate-binding protein/oligopeptide transport system substrate-binding protein
MPVTRSPRAEEPPGAAGGGTYRRPLRNDPATLDPVRIGDVYGRSIAQQVFDGLVQFDQTLAIVPALAEFWKASRDGLTWTFAVRKGVRFHHGREVTADDVVFSLARLLDPRIQSSAASLFAGIKGARDFQAGRAGQVSGLRALDRHTIQVTLEDAPVPFVSSLAVGHAKIVPRDVAEQRGEGFGEHPIGTGPFRFVRWERGKEIVLDANRDYFGGAPRLARIVYRIFRGERADAIYDEFRKGNLEDALVPSRDYHRVIKDPRHVYVKRSMFNVRFYGLNTRIKPLTDRRVRQAIVHAIDREDIVEGVYLGRSVVARGVLPPGTLGFDPQLTGYSHDPGRARDLLAEAGHQGGTGLPVIEFWSSVKDQRVLREHEQIRRSLEAVGIRAAFKYQTDWRAFSRMLAEGKAPIFLYAWYADVPDPDNFLYQLFHSRSDRNFTGYANPTVDDLLLRARAERDLARRVELYRRAERRVLDDAPIVPMWHYTYERLFQPYVRSIEVNGLGDPYIPLRKVWLERPR